MKLHIGIAENGTRLSNRALSDGELLIVNFAGRPNGAALAS